MTAPNSQKLLASSNLLKLAALFRTKRTFSVFTPKCIYTSRTSQAPLKRDINVPKFQFHRLEKVVPTIRQYSKIRTDFSELTGAKINGRSLAVGMLLLGVSGTLWYQYGYCDDAEETKTAHKYCPGRKKSLTLEDAIAQANDLVQRIKDECGSPGLVIGVSIDGKPVWSEGLGYADLENRVKCTPDSIFRIASISKPITMAAVAKEWEAGKLDLDKPVQFYVPEFPDKTFNGEKVTITTRQLVSQLSGIRHYSKDYMQKKDKVTEETKQGNQGTNKESSTSKTDGKQSNKNTGNQAKKDNSRMQDNSEGNKCQKKTEVTKDSKSEECYIKENFSSVTESLKLFKDDPLVNKPNEKFLYTTHGWTLISAVLEGARKEPFEKIMKKFLTDLDLRNTYLEKHEPIIYNRGRHYQKNKKGRLTNVPYVDLSYKYAGGGLISNVHDLLKFGNVMLYSYQYRPSSSVGSKSENNNSETSEGNSPQNEISEQMKNDDSSHGYRSTVKPGFLEAETVKMLWSPVTKTNENENEMFYGMGWYVVQEKHEYGCCRHQKYSASHTGGAVGASSVLVILPSKGDNFNSNCKEDCPKGVIVAVIVNIQSVNLETTAFHIAEIFENVHTP